MNERMECQTCVGNVIDAELYLFAAEANRELDELKKLHSNLIDRYVDAIIRADEAEARLDRLLSMLLPVSMAHPAEEVDYAHV